jgi:hypothetical protein
MCHLIPLNLVCVPEINTLGIEDSMLGLATHHYSFRAALPLRSPKSCPILLERSDTGLANRFQRLLRPEGIDMEILHGREGNYLADLFSLRVISSWFSHRSLILFYSSC